MATPPGPVRGSRNYRSRPGQEYVKDGGYYYRNLAHSPSADTSAASGGGAGLREALPLRNRTSCGVETNEDYFLGEQGGAVMLAAVNDLERKYGVGISDEWVMPPTRKKPVWDNQRHTEIEERALPALEAVYNRVRSRAGVEGQENQRQLLRDAQKALADNYKAETGTELATLPIGAQNAEMALVDGKMQANYIDVDAGGAQNLCRVMHNSRGELVFHGDKAGDYVNISKMGSVPELENEWSLDRKGSAGVFSRLPVLGYDQMDFKGDDGFGLGPEISAARRPGEERVGHFIRQGLANQGLAADFVLANPGLASMAMGNPSRGEMAVLMENQKRIVEEAGSGFDGMADRLSVEMRGSEIRSLLLSLKEGKDPSAPEDLGVGLEDCPKLAAFGRTALKHFGMDGDVHPSNAELVERAADFNPAWSKSDWNELADEAGVYEEHLEAPGMAGGKVGRDFPTVPSVSDPATKPSRKMVEAWEGTKFGPPKKEGWAVEPGSPEARRAGRSHGGRRANPRTPRSGSPDAQRAAEAERRAAQRRRQGNQPEPGQTRQRPIRPRRGGDGLNPVRRMQELPPTQPLLLSMWRSFRDYWRG